MPINMYLRDIPDDVYEIICDKQNEMKKRYHKNISRELAITRLIRDSIKQDVNTEKAKT